MVEYITKEQAIEAAWVIELYNSERDELEEEIKALPAADVVEVIRCKDCVKNGKCMLYSEYRYPFFDEDFCSYGWDGEE